MGGSLFQSFGNLLRFSNLDEHNTCFNVNLLDDLVLVLSTNFQMSNLV